MTITIPAQLEAKLRAAAERAGVPDEVSLAVSVLENALDQEDAFRRRFDEGVQLARASWNGVTFEEIAEFTRSELLPHTAELKPTVDDAD